MDLHSKMTMYVTIVQLLRQQKCLNGLGLNAVISLNESTRIIAGHVIYNPAYTYKFKLKTTYLVPGNPF